MTKVFRGVGGWGGNGEKLPNIYGFIWSDGTVLELDRDGGCNILNALNGGGRMVCFKTVNFMVCCISL